MAQGGMRDTGGEVGEEPPANFGDALRDYRRAAGLTQEELAARARLSAKAISALERGVNGAPAGIRCCSW